MSKSKTIVEKVIDFIKADDKSLVEAMKKSIINEATNQIEDAKLEIDAVLRKQVRNAAALKAQLEEAKEQELESFMQIELIKGNDARKEYIRKSYLQQIANAKYKVATIENRIDIEAEFARETVDDINKQIEQWQEILDFWTDSSK